MEVVKLPLPFSENAQTLLKALLSVCETVLNWGFTLNVHHRRFNRMHKRMVTMFETYEAEKTPSLKLNSNWTDLIMDTNVTNLFFDVSLFPLQYYTLSMHGVRRLVVLYSHILSLRCIGKFVIILIWPTTL